MTDVSTSVSLQPFVDSLAPYVTTVVVAVVGGGVTFAVKTFHRWVGTKVDEAQMDAIRKAAQTEAGVMVAQAEDNLAHRSISVSDPAVISAAARIGVALPGIIKAMGITPDGLGRIVAGEIGKLQAQTPAPAPVVAPATPAK